MNGNKKLAQSLREVAEWLDRLPDSAPTFRAFSVDAWPTGTPKEALSDCAGEWKKKLVGGYFFLQQRMGLVNVVLNWSREKVCRRVVIGQRWVEPTAGYYEDEVKWECPESLLGEAH